MKQYIQDEIGKSLAAIQRISADEEILTRVQEVARACIAALRNGKKILLAGNGGSAADAQHLAGELVSRLKFDRPGLAAFALTTDAAVMTAIGNDYGYEELFSRQLNAVGTAGDAFIAISTSGRSPNILRALEEARRKSLLTVGLTGKSSAVMASLCDYCIQIPSSETTKIQEGYMILGHILCGLIECEMFGADKPGH